MRSWLKRLKAPLWIWWNVTLAALGGNGGVSRFADRRRTPAHRRLMWRVLLTLALLVKAALLSPLVVLGAVLLSLGAPVAAVVYLWGGLREIWRYA
jgi:hypothetical protein